MPELKRELSLPIATLYGVGIILGAGIYVLIGKGAGIAGNALWAAFALSALIASFTGLSYAELSSMFPRAAAEYNYMKNASGSEFIGFLVQWVMILAMIVAVSTVSLGFGGYLMSITGIPQIAGAVGAIILLSAVNYWGIKESAAFAVVATLVEMGGLLLVISLGALFTGGVEINYFHSPGGFRGLLTATALIFFAYIGFEELVNTAEETKDAATTVPKALLLSLVISTILYIFVAIYSIKILGAEALAASKAPIADVVGTVLPNAHGVVSLIALFATANTVLAIMIAASRMIYGLAEHGRLPGVLSTVSNRGTPLYAVVLVTVLATAALSLGGVEAVALFTDVGIFTVYLAVNAGVIMLRYRRPEADRPFRIPGSIGRLPVIPVLGILSSFVLFLHFEPIYLLYEAGVLVLGGIVYALLE